MSKARFQNGKQNGRSDFANQAALEATIYSTSMRLMTAGGLVLQDTFGFTQEQAAAWAQETIRRANPDNAGDKFVADKVSNE